MLPLRTLALAPLLVASACAGAAPAPAPVVTLPAPSSTGPAVASAPPGETWVSAERAARITTQPPRPPAGLALLVVPARVDVDEEHATPVRAPLTGTVRSIEAAVDARVRKGTPLVTVDADVAQGPTVFVASARLEHSAQELRRIEVLFEMHAASVADLERVRAAHEAARAALVDERARLRRSVKTVVATAPADGTLVRVAAQPGHRVVGESDDPFYATELALVADLDHLALVADDPPPEVEVGAPARFATDALPSHVYESRVTIAPRDPRLRCPVDNPDRRLQLGMRGRLSFDHPGAPGLAVPRRALAAGGAMVLVRAGTTPDGRVRFVDKPVKVEFDGGPDAPIVTVSGLAGDELVVDDAASVR